MRRVSYEIIYMTHAFELSKASHINFMKIVSCAMIYIYDVFISIELRL